MRIGRALGIRSAAPESRKISMTGPGGIQTKRDQRRDSRRGQFQQRQLERQRARQAQIRRQRTIRYASIGGGLVVLLLVMGFIVHAVTSGSGSSSSTTMHGRYTTPATGDTRDGMQCLGYETLDQHIHSYLTIYENGKQTEVPAGVGIPSGTCIYSLHVHEGQPNVIHIEAPNHDTYTLGQFFDIWGKQLNATQIGDLKADATHKLQFYTIDENGQPKAYTGDPWNIPLKSHETIVILYNSPDVTPKPFTNWGTL